jgi:hypothetical protein
MKSRQARRCSIVAAGAFAAIGLTLTPPDCRAETLRVTTWNLEPRAADAANPATGKDEFPAEQAAAVLRRLNPDVLLLQQVRDWRMCDQLAQALKPSDYKVLICSSFGAARGGASDRQQVAILSKAKAYFAWSDAWRKGGEEVLPGGLAFAALQHGGQRVGLISVQAGTEVALPADVGQSAARLKAQAAAVDQLLEQVSSVGKWETNQVQVFVVSGTFDPGRPEQPVVQETPLRLLEHAGFGLAILQAPAGEPVAQPGPGGSPGGMADYFFTLPAGCAANPRIESAAEFAHQPMTCDVELAVAGTALIQTARTAPLPASDSVRPNPSDRARAELEPSASAPEELSVQPKATATAPFSQPSTLNPQLLWITAGALGGGVTLGALVWLLVRRGRAIAPAASALITGWAETEGVVPSSYTVVLGTRSGTAHASADEGAPAEPNPLVRVETPGTTQTQAEVLRQRALAAEERADRAAAVIRHGLIPHLGYWLKQRLVQKLVADRARMLETQRAATLVATAVEKRLARIELQVRRQNDAYQEQIEALTQQLEVAREENRALIRERIAQVKAEREAADARENPQSRPGESAQA